MSESEGVRAWTDATLGAALIAVDPVGLGGVVLGGYPGAVRDRWLKELGQLLPAETPQARFLPHMDDASLVGGLDLTATLHAGRPQVRHGLLTQCDQGLLILPMAERLSPSQAGMLGAVLDDGEVRLERDGFSRRWPARLGLVVMDESLEGDDGCAGGLLDRCAFRHDLSSVSVRDLEPGAYGAKAVASARRRLSRVTEGDDLVAGLCAAAQALGIMSLRAPLLALRAARAAAALVGEPRVQVAQAELAVRLVFGCRAQKIPEQAHPEQDRPEQSPPEADPPDPSSAGQPDAASAPPSEDVADSDPADDSAEENAEPGSLGEFTELLVQAAQGAVKPMIRRSLGRARAGESGPAGRAGPVRLVTTRGRPMPAGKGAPGSGRRLDLLATLRAAAPWQRLRETSRPGAGPIVFRRDDLRVRRYQQHAATLTIFVVDASGSAAMQRLGEAKGAVELLLGDCYVRRDSVALIAFRGRGADLLLPPTRSLVRAKRSLAHLTGGGSTPLAAGMDAAAELAARSLARGLVPTVVLLTDGRGNVTREGVVDRREAERDALTAAGQLRALGIITALVDVSPRGQAFARQLAGACDAWYAPLPHADARSLSRTVGAFTAGSSGRAA